jgi:polar amino acid transport system permease protein
MDAVQWQIIGEWAPQLLAAALVTLQITAMSFVVALFIGAAAGVVTSRGRWWSMPVVWYIEFFRGTPLLVQLFFIYYGLPQIGVVMTAEVAAVLGLGLNGGAYVAEIVRGALMGIDQGQYDAAHALGFPWPRMLVWVIAPQALRIAVPPLVNSFAALLKESSLVSLLAITEIMNIANQIYSRTFRAFEIFAVVAVMYFVMTFAFSRASKVLERRLSRHVRPA